MSGFAERLLAWFAVHGRHDLPWQQPRTAYRVWVSEIMLQQTRVETAIPYFLNFIRRFPDLAALAAASSDEVLHLWSGLGYYARARNLHQTAQQLMARHGGVFPGEREALEALPGIGRSTAAAILAQACGQREAILDGNVRRVLARHAGIEGWPGQIPVQRTLWRIAEQRLPHARLADYTQALMDLGAGICIRRRPLCTRCPVAGDCVALATGRVEALPTPRPTKILPVRTRWAALVRSPDGVFLERRAPTGIWGGLYSLPEAQEPKALCDVLQVRWPGLRKAPPRPDRIEPDRIEHVFSHYRLDLRILHFELPAGACGIMEGQGAIWYKTGFPVRVGLPAPIERFLKDHGNPNDDANG